MGGTHTVRTTTVHTVQEEGMAIQCRWCTYILHTCIYCTCPYTVRTVHSIQHMAVYTLYIHAHCLLYMGSGHIQCLPLLYTVVVHIPCTVHTLYCIYALPVYALPALLYTVVAVYVLYIGAYTVPTAIPYCTQWWAVYIQYVHVQCTLYSTVPVCTVLP